MFSRRSGGRRARVAAFVALLAVTLPVLPKGHAIVAGVPASSPGAAASLLTDAVVSTCGAVVVSPDWVLTAAHCLSSGRIVTVRTGTLATTTGGLTHSIVRTVLAPKPSDRAAPDLALLRLGRPTTVAPVRLAAAPPGEGTKLQAVGWGRTSPTVARSAILRQLTLQVVQPAQCSGLSGGELCVLDTISPIGSLCFGDSGGPVYLATDTRVLVGITSRGGVAGERGICSGSTVLVDVSRSVPWIAETIRS